MGSYAFANRIRNGLAILVASYQFRVLKSTAKFHGKMKIAECKMQIFEREPYSFCILHFDIYNLQFSLAVFSNGQTAALLLPQIQPFVKNKDLTPISKLI